MEVSSTPPTKAHVIGHSMPMSHSMSIATESNGNSSSMASDLSSSDDGSPSSPGIPRMNLTGILGHSKHPIHSRPSMLPTTPHHTHTHTTRTETPESLPALPSGVAFPGMGLGGNMAGLLSHMNQMGGAGMALPSVHNMMFNSAMQGTAVSAAAGSPLGNPLANPAVVAALASQQAAMPVLTPDAMSQAMSSVYAMWGPTSAIAHAMAMSQQTTRRPRSEKKPIPDEQKDDKYYDRRKRNNNAAKKSRDSRKAREDEIAIRASFLEKENAILRAQVATLREEANSLRQLLLQKRSQV